MASSTHIVHTTYGVWTMQRQRKPWPNIKRRRTATATAYAPLHLCVVVFFLLLLLFYLGSPALLLPFLWLLFRLYGLTETFNRHAFTPHYWNHAILSIWWLAQCLREFLSRCFLYINIQIWPHSGMAFVRPLPLCARFFFCLSPDYDCNVAWPMCWCSSFPFSSGHLPVADGPRKIQWAGAWPWAYSYHSIEFRVARCFRQIPNFLYTKKKTTEKKIIYAKRIHHCNIHTM